MATTMPWPLKAQGDASAEKESIFVSLYSFILLSGFTHFWLNDKCNVFTWSGANLRYVLFTVSEAITYLFWLDFQVRYMYVLNDKEKMTNKMSYM